MPIVRRSRCGLAAGVPPACPFGHELIWLQRLDQVLVRLAEVDVLLVILHFHSEVPADDVHERDNRIRGAGETD